MSLQTHGSYVVPTTMPILFRRLTERLDERHTGFVSLEKYLFDRDGKEISTRNGRAVHSLRFAPVCAPAALLGFPVTRSLNPLEAGNGLRSLREQCWKEVKHGNIYVYLSDAKSGFATSTFCDRTA